jgi:hypothetical protein
LYCVLDLGCQPGSRIAGSGGKIPRPGAQAKTQNGYFRLHDAD